MGSVWMHNALAPLSNALGSYLKTYPGYETNSRSSGGFDKIMGLIMHHDADPPSGNDKSATDYCAVNAEDSPIGNFHVHRSGDVWWMAAGASNHAGKGGAITTSKGTVGLDNGNKNLIGIEASNDGVGETWPQIQLENYLKLVTELCKLYQLDPDTDVHLHNSWCQPSCPGRKIDPAGPTPSFSAFGGTSGRKTWDINAVRKEVSARLNNTPTTPPPVGDTDWKALGATYTTPPATMVFGTVYENVTWLQAVLSSLGLYNEVWVGGDNIDGVQQYNLYGTATDNAVKGFQQKYGLTVDEVYGTVTANKMYSVRGK